MKSNSEVAVKRILVIRLSAMGDVAMTVPVLKSLINQHPDVQITLLSRPFFKPIFGELPNVTFVEIDLKKDHKGIWGIFQLFNLLKSQNFDAVADLHGVLRTHLLRFLFSLSGIETAMIDKGRAEKRALTRTKNKVLKPLKTTHERYADVFRKLGFEMRLESNVKDRSINMLTQLASSEQNPPRLSTMSDIHPSREGILCRRVGIAPFAQHAAKQYPLAFMKEVVFRLAENYEVYLFGGGAKEKEELDKWANEKPDPVSPQLWGGGIYSAAGRYSFTEELKLISTLDLMISMDSGNGHLAANFGVKVLTIWGLTHPFAGFAPYGSTNSNWLMPDLEQYPNIPTSIYGNNTPEGYEKAMEGILPEAILRKVEEMLG